jgi:hypothetical protein
VEGIREASECTSPTLSSSTGTCPKWLIQHQQLQCAMRSMRQSNGQSESSQHAVRMMSPPDDRVPCPHCGRRFNDTVAQRHVPKCKDIMNKPKTLTRKI